jgi:pSer/pThr/pTyr-binding forkhead associated (FHA) protein
VFANFLEVPTIERDMHHTIHVTLRYESGGSEPPGKQEIDILLNADSNTSYIIGREPTDTDDLSCFVALYCNYCSQRHARLSLVGAADANEPMLFRRKRGRSIADASLQVLLKDLNSTNGTFVNMRRVREALLQDGDVVIFGGGKDASYGDMTPLVDALVCWRVHIRQDDDDLLDTPPPISASLVEPATTIHEVADWLSGCSREFLEKLRASHSLPDSIIDCALQINTSEGQDRVRHTIVLAAPSRELSMPAIPVSPLLRPSTDDVASTVHQDVAVPEQSPDSPLLIPSADATILPRVSTLTTRRSQTDMGDTVTHNHAERSASAEALPPPQLHSIYPPRVSYATVRVGRAVFSPRELEASTATRMLSRLHRKRGPEAGWQLECNETHVTWSMMSPLKGSDSDAAPVTFSVPITSIDWVGLGFSVRQEEATLKAPRTFPPGHRGKGKKVGNKKTVGNLLEQSQTVRPIGTLVFALKSKLCIPLLPSEEVFGTKHDLQWFAFQFPCAEETQSWARAFEGAYCRRFQLSPLRVLTTQDIQTYFPRE